MKLSLQNSRKNERGFFLVVVLLALASIMVIYIAVNGTRLNTLKKEIRLIEQKQVERLNRLSATNSPTLQAN